MSWTSLFRPTVVRSAATFARDHAQASPNRTASTAFRDYGLSSASQGSRGEEPILFDDYAHAPIAEDVRRRQLALLVRYVAITRVR